MKISVPLKIQNTPIPVIMELGELDCEVKELGLSMIESPQPRQFGISTRTIFIKSKEMGDLVIVLKANDPDKLRFPGELPGGAVPPSRESLE
jgi:hypothetical protein